MRIFKRMAAVGILALAPLAISTAPMTSSAYAADNDQTPPKPKTMQELKDTGYACQWSHLTKGYVCTRASDGTRYNCDSEVTCWPAAKAPTRDPRSTTNGPSTNGQATTSH